MCVRVCICTSCWIHQAYSFTEHLHLSYTHSKNKWKTELRCVFFTYCRISCLEHWHFGVVCITAVACLHTRCTFLGAISHTYTQIPWRNRNIHYHDLHCLHTNRYKHQMSLQAVNYEKWILAFAAMIICMCDNVYKCLLPSVCVYTCSEATEQLFLCWSRRLRLSVSSSWATLVTASKWCSFNSFLQVDKID